MSKLAIPEWAKRPMFKTRVVLTPEPDLVLTRKTRKGDRHKPGYMAEYMRKYRAGKNT